MTTLAATDGIGGRRPGRVAAIAAIYLVLCLQQVVVFRWLGSGISLGTLAILAVGGGVSAWALLHHGLPVRLRWPLAAILVCGAVLAASVLASAQPLLAFKFAARLGLALLLLWACLNLAVSSPALIRDAALAALAVLLLAVLAASLAWLRWPPVVDGMLAFHPPETYKYWPREAAIYEHPSIFGAVAVLVFLLTAHAQWREGTGRLRLWLAGGGAVAALALSQSRNAFMPIFLVGLWWLVSGPSRRRPGGGAVTLGLLLGAAGLALLTATRLEELLSAIDHGLLTALTLGRTYLWAGAVDAWLSAPWLGLGPGVFQFLTPEFTGGRFHVGELHAHNLFLALLSETGLAGLAAFLFLLYALARPLLERLQAPDDRDWLAAWLITFLSLGLFDHYLPFYGFSIHCMLALAYLYALPPGRGEP